MVVVAIIALVVYSGGFAPKKSVDINISAEAPKIPDVPKSN